MLLPGDQVFLVLQSSHQGRYERGSSQTCRPASSVQVHPGDWQHRRGHAHEHGARGLPLAPGTWWGTTWEPETDVGTRILGSMG